MTLPWKTAWITGASSGIGRALALRLAREGVRVAASARRQAELASLAGEQDGISAFALDVTDREAVACVVKTIEAQLGPIDLAVLNAGIGRQMGIEEFDPDFAARTMAVNYHGVVNGVAALMPGVRKRRSGHLAFVSSLAGYRGLPRGAAYSPTKAAVISLAESLEPELYAIGVKISVVNPGYVATEMTANAKHPMPYLMSADEAARIIVKGLRRGKFEIAFPWQMAALVKFARMLPYPAYFWAMEQKVEKPPPRA